MTRETEQGVQMFSHCAIPLTGGHSVELAFGNWVTTHNGQQTTQTLTNQATG